MLYECHISIYILEKGIISKSKNKIDIRQKHKIGYFMTPDESSLFHKGGGGGQGVDLTS